MTVFFLCKTTKIISFVVFVSGACAPGWKVFNGRCYELNIQTKLYWDGAKKQCKAQKATLMQVDTKIEEKFLLASHFFNDIGVDAFWLGFKGVYIAVGFLIYLQREK